ncbi:MAG: hypothetical protein OXH38_04825 [Chloroflexi bacterium]|nr:hypothetical protein [Chloroflexota bacterium]
MAIFDTARLRDVLVRGRIAEEAPARELVDELETQMDSVFSGYPTHDRLGLEIGRVLQAIAELKQHQSESEARMAEMLRQQSVHINQAVGVVLAGIALAVGLILGFG